MIVLLAVGVAVAMGLLGFVLLFVFTNDDADVQERLNDYAEDAAATAGVREDGTTALAETRVLQDAVELTARYAPKGVLAKVEHSLEQADLPLRPAEVVFFWTAALLIAAIFGLLVGGLGTAVVITATLAVGPALYVMHKRRARLQAFAAVLPDTLQLLAGSLRAGFSLVQAVGAVAQEATDPMKTQLQLAFNENQLGRSMEDALDDVSDRMENADFAWVVMAVRIQREVGGNLAELLDTVADTMAQRERVRREIRSLTAEGRLSAWMLGALPFVLGAVLAIINPEYLKPLVTTPIGIVLIIGGLLLNGVGFIWLRKILNIEV
jgi:tight adherence protein B